VEVLDMTDTTFATAIYARDVRGWMDFEMLLKFDE
tara:strand:+ start:78 stop:182 length:105 start_codon:yes stop_codon:yes gene_type:complete